MGAKWLDTPLTRELKRQGRRQSWLAARLGIKPWTLSRIEAGVQSPPPDFYARAALALDVTEADVLPDGAPKRLEAAVAQLRVAEQEVQAATAQRLATHKRDAA